MSIPKTIKIGGLRYAVKVVEEKDLPSSTAGQILPDKKLIQVLKSVQECMEISLLHEIFHAINMEMPEERIEFLAQAMYQVIVDNPKVFESEVK